MFSGMPRISWEIDAVGFKKLFPCLDTSIQHGAEVHDVLIGVPVDYFSD